MSLSLPPSPPRPRACRVLTLKFLLWRRYTHKNGKWDQGELVESPYISLHINSNVLHYGQALFEGLKSFHGADGKVRCWFNPQTLSFR